MHMFRKKQEHQVSYIKKTGNEKNNSDYGGNSSDAPGEGHSTEPG